MSIADRMIQFSTLGAVITCPGMKLRAGDHEPPVVVGEGEITVTSTTLFEYILRGTPADVGPALRMPRRTISNVAPNTAPAPSKEEEAAR